MVRRCPSRYTRLLGLPMTNGRSSSPKSRQYSSVRSCTRGIRIAPASAYSPGAKSRSVYTRPPTRFCASRMRGSWPWRSSSNPATSPAMPPQPMTTLLGTCGIDSRPSDGVFRTAGGTGSAISGGSSVETSSRSSLTASGRSNAAHLLGRSLRDSWEGKPRAVAAKRGHEIPPDLPKALSNISERIRLDRPGRDEIWRALVMIVCEDRPRSARFPGTRARRSWAPGGRDARMARHKTVADAMWDMLAGAGVRRCYGIVGDALNPVIDALRRNPRGDFVHVRHEEAGGFAAVVGAGLTQAPGAGWRPARPGGARPINGLRRARQE